MSAETREAEKNAFSELHRKSNFLPSQRCSPATHGHTASSGPIKMSLQGAITGVEMNRKLFAAEPSVVVFTNYHPGRTYEVHVHVYVHVQYIIILYIQSWIREHVKMDWKCVWAVRQSRLLWKSRLIYIHNFIIKIFYAIIINFRK